MSFPTILPNDLWGFLAILVIAAGSTITALAANRGRKTTAIQGDVDSRIEAVVNPIVKAMNEGFKERDRRISELAKKFDDMRAKYYAALRYGRDWRERHPESIRDVNVPLEIEDDL